MGYINKHPPFPLLLQARPGRQAALQLQQPVHPGRQLTYGRLVRVYKHAVLPSLFRDSSSWLFSSASCPDSFLYL